MPLELRSLSLTERQFLADHLPDTDDYDRAQDLAARLLSQMVQDPQLLAQAVREVRNLLSSRRGQEIRADAIKQSRFYQFGVKHHSSSPEHHTFYNWKVHEHDFAKFCQHYGLSERSMLKLAAGEVDSYKGWCQGSSCGNLGFPRAKYLREHNPSPAGVLVSASFQGEWPSAQWTKTFLPAQWWSPPAE